MGLPATEDFTYADGSSLEPGTTPNWTDFAGSTRRMRIASNQLTVGSAGIDDFAAWNADTFVNDQYSQIVIKAISNGQYLGPAVRCSLVASTCYFAYADDGSDGIYIVKRVIGVSTDLNTSLGVGWAVNDVIRLEVSGSNLTLKKNGSTVLTASDSDIASGAAGVCGFGTYTVPLADTWEGGNLVAAAATSSKLYISGHRPAPFKPGLGR